MWTSQGQSVTRNLTIANWASLLRWFKVTNTGTCCLTVQQRTSNSWLLQALITIYLIHVKLANKSFPFLFFIREYNWRFYKQTTSFRIHGAAPYQTGFGTVHLRPADVGGDFFRQSSVNGVKYCNWHQPNCASRDENCSERSSKRVTSWDASLGDWVSWRKREIWRSRETLYQNVTRHTGISWGASLVRCEALKWGRVGHYLIHCSALHGNIRAVEILHRPRTGRSGALGLSDILRRFLVLGERRNMGQKQWWWKWTKHLQIRFLFASNKTYWQLYYCGF